MFSSPSVAECSASGASLYWLPQAHWPGERSAAPDLGSWEAAWPALKGRIFARLASDAEWQPMPDVPGTAFKVLMPLDYGAAAAKYVDAFFQNINWEVVEQRFEKATKFEP